MQVCKDRLWCVKLLHSVSTLLSISPVRAGFTPLCPCVLGCCSDRLVVTFMLGVVLNETPAGQLCWHRLRSLLPSHRAFLPLLLPEHCSVLTVSLFPVVLQWQNTRQALTAHFALAWRTRSGFCVIGRVTVWGVCWASEAYKVIFRLYCLSWYIKWIKKSS